MLADNKNDRGWQEFLAALKDVQKLAEQRHLIPHNDLWVDILNNGAFEQKIMSGRNRLKAMDSRLRNARAEKPKS